MRPLVLVGILALMIGAFLLVRGGTFTTEREIASVGELELNVDEEHAISPWIGGGVVLAGILLIGAGMRKRA
jgi:hypothetical protein